MPGRENRETGESSRRQLQGLPVIRRNVAGIDLGSERHWVCAPTRDGSGREIASFGATTPELLRMAEWLKARQVESAAMESTGVYCMTKQHTDGHVKKRTGFGSHPAAAQDQAHSGFADVSPAKRRHAFPR